MRFIALFTPPELQALAAQYESCWDGPMSLAPIATIAVGVLIATVVFAGMWFSPGPKPRRDWLRELGLFAAAGLAWGLAWVAVPSLLMVIVLWWDAVSRGSSLWITTDTGTVILVLVGMIVLVALILRMPSMRTHVAAVRERWPSWQYGVFVVCTVIYGLWLPVTLLAAIIIDLNASDGPPCREW